MKALLPLLLFLPISLFAQYKLQPDYAFGDSARVYLEIGPSTNTSAADVSKAIGLQSDGKLVVAGYSNDIGGTEDWIITLARFHQDGSLDTSFGKQGIAKKDLWEDDEAWDMEILPDDKILVAGRSWKGNEQRMNVARFTAEGQIDSSFHHNGGRVHEVGRSSDGAFDLAVQPDGKILLMGWVDNSNWRKIDWGIRRLMPDGQVDLTFADQGTWLFNHSGYNDKANAVAIQPDGYILVGGYVEDTLAVLRLTPDGQIDSSFADKGMFKKHVNYGVADIQLDDQGRILFATKEEGKSLIFRLLPDGRLDHTFGSMGIYTHYQIDRDLFAGYSKIALLADGQILCIGVMNHANDYDDKLSFFLLDERGKLVSSFGNNGVAFFYVCKYRFSAPDFVFLHDGAMAITGGCENGTGNADFFVMKLTDQANGGGGGGGGGSNNPPPPAANKTFSSYPNPAIGGEVTIEIPTEWVGESVQVIDFTGRIAREEIASSEQTSLSLADLPPRAYYIRIKDQVKMVVITE